MPAEARLRKIDAGEIAEFVGGTRAVKFFLMIASTAVLLVVAACAKHDASVSAGASAAACQQAMQQVDQHLASASATAADRPNPNYNPTASYSPGDFAGWLGNVPTFSGDKIAARQEALLASYIIVQHPSCFRDDLVAAAQMIIDQSKPK